MTIGLTFESTQNQNSHFGAPKQRFETFVINHYAGSVAYTTNDFCEKNKDTLSVDVVQMMQKSKVQFLQKFHISPEISPEIPYFSRNFSKNSIFLQKFLTLLHHLHDIH